MKIERSEKKKAMAATGIEDLGDYGTVKEVYTTDQAGLPFSMSVAVEYAEGKRPEDICTRAMRMIRDVESRDQLSLSIETERKGKRGRGKVSEESESETAGVTA
jgi:P2-related tail formation protein